MHHPTNRITHTTAFVTSVVDHCLEREIVKWVHHEGSIRRPIVPLANALTTKLHLAPEHDGDIPRNAVDKMTPSLRATYLEMLWVR